MYQVQHLDFIYWPVPVSVLSEVIYESISRVLFNAVYSCSMNNSCCVLLELKSGVTGTSEKILPHFIGSRENQTVLIFSALSTF